MRALLPLVTIVALASGAAPALAAPGALDPNFGVQGIALTSIADGDAQAAAVAPTADGGVISAGSAVSGGALGFALSRLTSAGAPDSPFGTGGVVTANLGHTTSSVNALAVESSGDILLAGSGDTAAGATELLLALYSPTGQLVSGFGTGGSELVAIGNGGDAQANAVVLDGANVLVAGRAEESNTLGDSYDEFFESFNATTGVANGTPYLGNFGNKTDTQANAIALDGSDVLLAGFTAAATGYKEALVTELSASGVPQAGFGSSGVSALAFGLDAVANAIAVQPSGTIVVEGTASTGQGVGEVMLTGLTSSGSLDTSFGSGGVDALAIGSGGDASGQALAVDAGGNLLIAGRAADSYGGQPAMLPLVARFTAAGQLDTSFAPASATPGAELLGCNSDGAFNAGYVDGSGNFVAAGASGANSTHQAFLVARLTDSATSGTGCGFVSGAPGGGSPGGGSPGGGTSTATTTTPGGTGPGSGTGPTSGCTRQQMKFGVLVVNACFSRQGTRELASGAISLDGLSIEPSPCTTVAFDTVAETITSECNQGGTGEVAISAPTSGGVVSGIPLFRGALAWTIPTADGDPLGELDVGSFAELEGFPLIGQVDPVALSGGILQLPLSTSLPSPFDSVTGSVTLQTQIGKPVSLAGLAIDVPEVWLGPLDIQSFDVSYNQSTDTWSGSAGASFASPLDYGVSAGAEFRDGSFAGFSASVSFGDPGVPLGDEGLFLNELGFGIQTGPLQISGSVGLSVADVFGLTGDLTVRIPHGGWDIRISGNLTVGGIGLASGYVEIDSNGNAFFGGGFNYGTCDLLCVQANADGWIDLSQGTFDAEVGAQTSVLTFPLVSATLNVSSKSFAVCGSVNYEFVTFSLGGAYTYGQGLSIMGGADVLGIKIGNGGVCDLSSYVLTAPTPVIGAGSGTAPSGTTGSGTATDAGKARFAHQTTATTADQLTVKPDTRGLSWRLQGSGAPPQVTISGPGGASLATNADGAPVKTGDALILQDPQADVTYVILARPKAGHWTITPQGTSTITKISTAAVLPPPHVTGHVTGSGLARQLHYVITPIPGQSVRFLEHEGNFTHLIATVTKPHGTIAFTLADGPTGRRTIIAQVLEGISVRRQLNVASYVTPAHLGPQRPVDLHARRAARTLHLIWRSGGGTDLYLVQMKATTGATTVRQTKATSLVLPLPDTAGATVTVTPRTTFAEQGPSATVKLPAPKAPKLRRAPHITGTAKAGHTLTCQKGSWSNDPTRYVTEWLSGGITLVRQDHPTLRLSTAEAGARITCMVTARNVAGLALGTSRKVTVAAVHRKSRPPKKKKR